MVKYTDIAAQLKAANSSMNITLDAAVRIADWLKKLGVPVGVLAFNPRGYGAAQNFIPVAEVEGKIPDNEPFALQLETNGVWQNVRLIADFIQWMGPYAGYEQVCREAGYTPEASRAEVVKAWG